MASKKQRGLIIALSCCKMVSETTQSLCSQAGFDDISKDAESLCEELQQEINRQYVDTKFSASDFKDTQAKILKLGSLWDTESVSIAAMHAFCEGILQRQISNIEGSRRLKTLHQTLTGLADKFSGWWHLFLSWFPNETAEDDSIKLYEEFALWVS